jgi:predicted ATP-grasp superfamily ATP-dependent carboligase
VQQQAVLIVAQSGRFLAQLAHRAGYPVWVADCFGDQDTLAVAERWLPLTDLHDHISVTKTLLDLSENQTCSLLYGSGIEAFYPILKSLPDTISLIGNPANIIEQVKMPHLFFPLLQHLDIPYPETGFTVDDSRSERWIRKPINSFGGQFITDSAKQSDSQDAYFQQYVEGKSGSALFLADGQSAQLYSFNQQFNLTHSDTPFLFSGLSTPLAITATLRQKINVFINQLVAHTGLLGFNSLDFIITSKNEVLVLELNPRLSASAQLIDSSIPIFDNHLAACTTQSAKEYQSPLIQRHLHTLFAPFDVVIPEFINWPSYCHDYPQPNMLIKQNAPICSVVIETPLSFKQSESEIQQSIFSLLGLSESNN